MYRLTQRGPRGVICSQEREQDEEERVDDKNWRD